MSRRNKILCLVAIGILGYLAAYVGARRANVLVRIAGLAGPPESPIRTATMGVAGRPPCRALGAVFRPLSEIECWSYRNIDFVAADEKAGMDMAYPSMHESLVKALHDLRSDPNDASRRR